MQILIIEDEPDFVRLVQRLLMAENFLVTSAKDGMTGLKMAQDLHPDVILLDWNLPVKDGLAVLKELKGEPKTRGIPVIMLTVRGKELDTVLALEMGADDYISKRALRPRELVARVHSVLRKSQAPDSDGKVLHVGPLDLDTSHRRVTLAGQPVDLRAKEFDLLHTFLTRPGRVLTRQFLMENVWGIDDYGASRTIDSTLARLRTKLGEFGQAFQSIKGIGYQFSMPEE
ncbi:MAG: response regulator transcription factor [Elusimicrobia bacterium]|nr:response regulator transcription factor [Elusimicrobiota bacterium]